jgi:hypothetical protein
VGIIVASKINPIRMVDGKSPRPHFRGKGAVELFHLAGIGVDGKEKERGVILPKGEVNRILRSRLSRTGVSPPADGFFNRLAKVTKSERKVRTKIENDE